MVLCGIRTFMTLEQGRGQVHPYNRWTCALECINRDPGDGSASHTLVSISILGLGSGLAQPPQRCLESRDTHLQVLDLVLLVFAGAVYARQRCHGAPCLLNLETDVVSSSRNMLDFERAFC